MSRGLLIILCGVDADGFAEAEGEARTVPQESDSLYENSLSLCCHSACYRCLLANSKR